MKNPLANIYEQMLLNEAEKSNLQNPSNDEIGSLKAKQELFGAKPKAVEGPDKAKVKQGPSYSVTTGTASAPKVAKTSSMSGEKPATEPKPEKPTEMKDTEVDPKKDEETEEKNEKPENSEEKKKKEPSNEGLVLSAFEALFKKTLSEELDEESEESEEEDVVEEQEDIISNDENNNEEPTIETEDESEGDLLSDLKELHSRLSEILSKLEDVAEEGDIEQEDEEYSEEDFEDEFGEEENEEAVKESVEKPKALGDAKGKGLMSKKNKIGKLSPKGGKAHTGSVKDDPEPKL